MVVKTPRPLTRRAVLLAAAGATPALLLAPAFAQDDTAAGDAAPNAALCGGCDLFVAPHGCMAMTGAASPDGGCKRGHFMRAS